MKLINAGVREGVDLDRTSSCSAKHRAWLKRHSCRKQRSMLNAELAARDAFGEYLEHRTSLVVAARKHLKVVASKPANGSVLREVTCVGGVVVASVDRVHRRAA